MRAPAGLGPAAADNALVLSDDAAHRRVGPDITEAAPGQAERRAHHLQVKAGPVLVRCHASEAGNLPNEPIRIDCFVAALLATAPIRQPADAGIRRKSASIAVRGDAAEKFAEILRFPEIAVDRGKTDVGDLIENRERLHDLFADLLGADFGFARAF